MKFKSIFIIFNVFITFTFLFFFLMPLFIAGVQQFYVFFSKYWIALVLFLVTIIAFNIYFITNWKFFHHLEKEDWHGLISYLEEKIYYGTSLSRQGVRILINSYLCTSNIEGIKKLETHLMKKKPQMIEDFALQLGIPYLLEQNHEESERYFGSLLKKRKVKEKDWIAWNYGISLMQQKKNERAQDVFAKLLADKTNPVVYLLSLYMLKSLVRDNSDAAGMVDRISQSFRKRYSRSQLSEIVDKHKSNIQVISIIGIIQSALDWLFPGETKENESPEG